MKKALPRNTKNGIGIDEIANVGASGSADSCQTGIAPGNMELLAPAGGPESLFYALEFGADAVYLAGRDFGLRSKAINFSDDELGGAIALAHGRGRKVYVAVNSLMHEGRLQALAEYMALLAELEADAVIVSDMAALSYARRFAPGLDIHVSTQASVCNHEAARMWHDLGASRIVCAREMSLAEIADLKRKAPANLEIEVFVHGAMCMSYSGRCLISSYLAGRSANEGNCAQPCRWSYALVEDLKRDEPMTVEEDGFGTYLLNSMDLNMLAHLDELRSAGVDSIKIEGRNKKAYYVACVVNAYRQVLDGAPYDDFAPELEAVSHRPYSTGFFFGEAQQSAERDGYLSTHDMVGTVDACVCGCVNGDAEEAAESEPEAEGRLHVVTFTLRNRVFEGDEVEVVSPGLKPFKVVVGKLAHEGERVAVADVAMRHYSFTCDRPLRTHDILRIRREGGEAGATNR
jgi:putative protease